MLAAFACQGSSLHKLRSYSEGKHSPSDLNSCREGPWHQLAGERLAGQWGTWRKGNFRRSFGEQQWIPGRPPPYSRSSTPESTSAKTLEDPEAQRRTSIHRNAAAGQIPRAPRLLPRVSPDHRFRSVFISTSRRLQQDTLQARCSLGFLSAHVIRTSANGYLSYTWRFPSLTQRFATRELRLSNPLPLVSTVPAQCKSP